MHTVTRGTMEPADGVTAGYQQGGQVPGKKGWRNSGKEEAWLPEASPHTMLPASHTTQFPLSESLSCALSRAQEAERSFLALNHAISARVSQEQAAATARSPESGKQCSLPPHTCPLFHEHRFIICIILIPSFWAPLPSHAKLVQRCHFWSSLRCHGNWNFQSLILLLLSPPRTLLSQFPSPATYTYVFLKK